MPEEAHITVKMPQSPALGRPAADNDLLWIWDIEQGKLKHCNVGDLPFSSGGGGGGGTMLGSPFKLRVTSSQVFLDDMGGGEWNTVISDTRLIGKTDYPVSCTQLNNASFRDIDLIYDAEAGMVTIKKFKLIEGEIVILYPDGISSGSGGGGSVTELQEQIDELKKIVAPFIPTLSGANGGLLLWGRPASEIPAGWVEATEWRGRFPLGVVPGDADYDYDKTGGSSTHTNTLEEMAPHDHELNERSTGGDWRTAGGSGTPLTSGKGSVIRKTDKEGGYEPSPGAPKVAKPYSIMNPFRTVWFIKYVGG